MLPSVLKQDVDRWTFEVYVTEALKLIAENTAVPAASLSKGQAGKSLSMGWTDIGKTPRHEETRTSEEIISCIRGKLKEEG